MPVENAGDRGKGRAPDRVKAKVNGKFVCAEDAGKSALIANRASIGLWEKFWVTKAQ